jgi:hypothetical protein
MGPSTFFTHDPSSAIEPKEFIKMYLPADKDVAVLSFPSIIIKDSKAPKLEHSK